MLSIFLMFLNTSFGWAHVAHVCDQFVQTQVGDFVSRHCESKEASILVSPYEIVPTDKSDEYIKAFSVRCKDKHFGGRISYRFNGQAILNKYDEDKRLCTVTEIVNVPHVYLMF